MSERLPAAIAARLEAAKKRQSPNWTEEEQTYIGSGGYIPPEPEIFTDAIVALCMGKHVLLQGPTGSGKTRLAESISAALDRPMLMINCSVDLDAEALLGHKTLVEENGRRTIGFVPGPVIRAMERGYLLYIDEINMARPETLPILNGVLDFRRSLYNPFTGETVRAKESFAVIAAINEGYVGTTPMNEALKNRFVAIDIPYLQGERLAELIRTQSELKDEKQIARFVTLSSDLTYQAKEALLSEEAASVRALLDACDLAVYLPPLRAIKRAIADKLEDASERQLVMSLAETIFERETPAWV
ncbi:MoxR family ATPase [Paenibacillus thermoaerophilus]